MLLNILNDRMEIVKSNIFCTIQQCFELKNRLNLFILFKEIKNK